MSEWRLGYEPEFPPDAHGFGEFFRAPGGNLDLDTDKEIIGDRKLHEQD